MIFQYLKKIWDRFLGTRRLNRELSDKINKQSLCLFYQINEVKSFAILKPFLPDTYFPITSFSLDFQIIQHIINDIAYFKPKQILEFGTGLSTIIIYNYITINNLDVKLMSIDNDKEFQDYVATYMELSSNIKLFHLPICMETASTRRGKAWYQIPDEHPVNDLKDIDLVIIDGPWGGLGKNARHGFISFIKEKMSNELIVFLDDIWRPDEIEIANEATKVLGLKLEDHYRYARLYKHRKYISQPNRVL